MRKFTVSLVLITCFFVAAPAFADEILEQLEAAVELYKKGDITGALEELDFAVAQLRQKKGENMGALFPEPLDGWTAEEFQSGAAGGVAFGGGITASRRYTKDGGGEAEIEVMSDSPMVQTMGALLSNPAIAGADKNTKLIRVNRQKALLKTESKDRAEITFLVDGKVLVQVKVNGLDDAEEAAKAYAEKIDLKKLKDLTM